MQKKMLAFLYWNTPKADPKIRIHEQTFIWKAILGNTEK